MFTCFVTYVFKASTTKPQCFFNFAYTYRGIYNGQLRNKLRQLIPHNINICGNELG
ncbi:MAG: hypothetical protein JWR61_925 [Ferruginibacter sp.]|nr:hypothetical protein [Ferruginibacter sp.]